MVQITAIVVIFAFILALQALADVRNKQKGCNFQKCRKPAYEILTAKRACRKGLKYVACVRRIIRKCEVYRKLFTKRALRELMSSLRDARNQLKGTGYCGDGSSLRSNRFLIAGFGVILLAYRMFRFF